ncbi:unnamed protein product [Strongylus vulgaris]|uniref:Mitochondrial carrier protein n=1 Tax=Strongylus vulgaris TaxID=40348 RepID=A0A3P7INA9_STRVU|nr:unnamed protein product [Strongylus vulgaris]
MIVLGGIANVYAGQPLDTVKVKVQTFPNLYKNWVVCLKDTYRLDGIRGLYAGTVPALAANIAENAVLFCAYGYCQKIVSIISGHRNVKTMTPLENASAGGLASIAAALVLCPTELVKCRLQAAREVGHKWWVMFALEKYNRFFSSKTDEKTRVGVFSSHMV